MPEAATAEVMKMEAARSRGRRGREAASSLRSIVK